MAEPLLIGVDIGSTNIKAVLFDRRGRVRGDAYRQTPVRTEGERTIFPVHGLTDAALDAIAEVTGRISPGDYVAGLSFASIGESFVLFDAAGEPVADIIAWYDRRAVGEAEEVVGTVGADVLFQTTGLTIDPIYSLCKLLWLRRNAAGVLDRAAGLAFVADWLAMRVCGECATDVSLASRSLLAAPMTGRWSPKMLRAFGFDEAFLPRILPAGSPLGPPTPWAAERLGLTDRCVISVGGHDHIVSSIAAGAANPAFMIDSAGTAEAILRTGPRLVENWPDGPLEFAQGGIWWADVPKPIIYLIGAMIDSGGALVRYRSSTGMDTDWQGLIARAREAPPGSAGFHPARGKGLEADPVAWSKAVFSGRPANGPRFRALLEVLSLQSKLLCDQLTNQAALPPVKEIRLVGGLAKNRLYADLKAAAFEAPIRVAEFPQFTALGAAIAAGLGAGLYSSLDVALDGIRLQWRDCSPDPALVHAAQTLRSKWNPGDSL